ncbi:MAG: hypothetical protein KDA20_08150 [Phycisphaerales bacterium]|nr:hypothetical protein [Phycisphaerales bacterium]
MGDRDMNNKANGGRIDLQRLPDAALIRAAADGEAGAAEALRARGITDAHARIAFEASLRDAVGRVMGHASAPSSLRAQVIAMMHHAQLDDHANADEPMRFVEAKARHDAHIAERDAHRRRMRPGLRRGIALAAVTALGAGAVWMGMQTSTQTGAPSLGANASFIDALSFVRHEHDDRAVFDAQYRNTFTVNVDEAVGIAERELGSMPTCLAKAIRGCKDSGMVFAGLSSCSVPGGAGAVHVMYWSVPDESAVSLFIAADPAGASATECPTKTLKCGTSYVCPKSRAAGTPLQVWRQDGFTFYLAAGHTEPVPMVRKLMEAPAREELLEPMS